MANKNVLTKVKGRAWTLGDNVNSESILMSGEEERWDIVMQHVLEFYDPEFAGNVQEGDVLVAGKNFGASSGRPSGQILRNVGIRALICESAGNVFYRNTWNIGLPVLKCPAIAGQIKKGDIIEVDIFSGTITNTSTNQTFQAKPIEPILLEIYQQGNLINWIINRKNKYSTIEMNAKAEGN